MKNTKATLKASWASHSLAQRALAYHRVRTFGSASIFLLMGILALLYPSDGPVKGMLIAFARFDLAT